MHRQDLAARLDAVADDKAGTKRYQACYIADWENLDEWLDAQCAIYGREFDRANGGETAG
jgi:hypothetical protein